MCTILKWEHANPDFWFQGKAKKVVPAQTLWFDILKAQIETGTPYMLYKVHLVAIQVGIPSRFVSFAKIFHG